MSCIFLTMEVWGSSMPISVTLEITGCIGHWKFPLKLVLKNMPRAGTSSPSVNWAQRHSPSLPGNALSSLSRGRPQRVTTGRVMDRTGPSSETLHGKRQKMKTDNTFRLINHKYPFIYPIWGQEQSARKP